MTITGPNADEAEYWSTKGLSWIENEASQDTILGPVSTYLVENAGFEPGMRVLDIGCGTGAHALAVAAKVQPGGDVLALDVSQPFLERVRTRAEAAGLPIDTLHADAQTAALPGGFDMATSRFGVMFFDDPAAAFANIGKALKPGGRMIFAAWAPVAVNPFWRLPGGIAAERLGAPPPSPPNAPGPMGLADLDYLRSVLDQSGLAEARVRQEEVILGHVGGAEAMADLSTRVGPAARIIEMFDASESDRAAIRDALAKAFEAYEDDDAFRLPATLNIIEARAA